MFRVSTIVSGLVLALSLPLAGCTDTEKGPSVVCVDVERVLSQSAAAKQAGEHLTRVRAVLQEGLDSYRKELEKSPEEKRRQELAQGLVVLQRQLQLEQAAARDVVSRHMLAKIEAWRTGDRENTMVVARQNLLAAPSSVDITADIISRMDAESVTFADLPKVTVRTPETDAAAADSGKKEGTAAKNDAKPGKKQEK